MSLMYTIKRTPEFLAWLKSRKDPLTRQRLGRRLQKAARGHLGDVKPVGGGGDKSTQTTDIADAIKLAATVED